MTLPWRKSLASRLLVAIGLATFLPLVLLMTAVLIEAYQANTAQTYATVEQTARRYAAVFEAGLREKLGLMRGLAAVTNLDDAQFARRVMLIDSDLKAVWTRRDDAPPGETARQRELYQAVRERGTEVLSEPDFTAYEASLGIPVFERGQFAGMVAITFSLKHFQEIVTQIHLFSTGYAVLVSHEGYRVAHPAVRFIGVQIGNDIPSEAARELLAKTAAGREFWYEKKSLLTGKWSRQYFSPVTVGRTANPWFLVVIVPVDEATLALDVLFMVLAAGSLVTLLLVAATTWRATRSVVLPLRSLARNAEAVAEGQLESRVRWDSQDEVGTLAGAFNRMTDRLVKTLRDQEDMVRERTASLEASLAELEQAQSQIVASERMAVLGQLTATIAHEVNTPLGAIQSSATYLRQSIVSRVNELPTAFRRMNEDDVEYYKTLVRGRGFQLKASVGSTDRKRRTGLTAKLRALGAADPEILADDIVSLVPPEQDEALIAAVARGQGPVLHLAAQSAAMTQAGTIILEAAGRAAATVSALVNYSRLHDIDAEQAVEPAKELDTILMIYYGVSKKGVDVTKEYEPGVSIRGDRGKLNQVWVNLINNALQAMNYKGRLLLRVRSTETGPQVSIANDGPRVPPELKDKIFQPFFTTKRAGEGTGLGLDICRRIVEAHQGSLTLGEEGKWTVFTTAFPPKADA